LKDYSEFSSENRKKIREIFKGKYLRCIFIQEENFREILLYEIGEQNFIVYWKLVKLVKN
ncbi:hypothetical protein, partial [Enterocloster clostridioformis]|uniref:hypothetical protein n=1 Tax=Enterocloster clostridioformis TaxID=1531 RepID=UPI001A9A65E9